MPNVGRRFESVRKISVIISQLWPDILRSQQANKDRNGKDGCCEYGSKEEPRLVVHVDSKGDVMYEGRNGDLC